MIRNIVLVTNEINPYRKSFYDRVYDYCHSIGVTFTVLLMTKVEHGYNWNYEEVKSDYAILMQGRHFTYPIVNHLNGEVVKYRCASILFKSNNIRLGRVSFFS